MFSRQWKYVVFWNGEASSHVSTQSKWRGLLVTLTHVSTWNLFMLSGCFTASAKRRAEESKVGSSEATGEDLCQEGEGQREDKETRREESNRETPSNRSDCLSGSWTSRTWGSLSSQAESNRTRPQTSSACCWGKLMFISTHYSTSHPCITLKFFMFICSHPGGEQTSWVQTPYRSRTEVHAVHNLL